jgi:polyphosphate glucokinase
LRHLAAASGISQTEHETRPGKLEKYEIRSPKFETNPNDKRNKSKTRSNLVSSIRILNLFRISAFEFRILGSGLDLKSGKGFEMNVLVVDIGGTNVKILATGYTQSRKFPSGPTLTPERMVSGVKELAGDWKYDVVTMGYPGPVLHGRPVAEPPNLTPGWVGFDYQAAFGRPVKIINDAAMQALGSYKGGKMLFLGLGTGLGSTLIVDGTIEPMELGHLPYKKGTYEDYVGSRGLDRLGKKKWRQHVTDVVARLRAALLPDEVVLGGGNVKKLNALPPGCREGDNDNAFLGGIRLWEGRGQESG